MSKKPLVRIDVPNLVMHLRYYETPELQDYYAIFTNCVKMLRERSQDRRLRRDVRLKARDKLKKARKRMNQIRLTLLARGAELMPKAEEWEEREQ